MISKLNNILLYTFVIFGFLLCISCKKEDTNSVETKQPIDNEVDFYNNLLMDRSTYDAIKLDLQNSDKAKDLVSSQLTGSANIALQDASLDLTNTANIDDATKVGKAIYKLSLQFFLFQEDERASKYLDGAKKHLLRWASLNKPTNHTPNESAFLNFIYGYSLIKARIDQNSKFLIDKWLSDRFIYYSQLGVRANNWETIRNALMINIAYVLNNNQFIQTASNDITKHHNRNYRADGASLDFLARDGFAYHTYDMFFAAQIVRTIYINKGRQESNNIVNHRSTNWVDVRFNPSANPVLGGSFADAVYFMKPYVIDPAKNIHLEFVNTEWDPDKTRSDYNKPYNSAGSRYVFVEVAAIMKDEMLIFLRKTNPNFDKYSDLTFYLNSFGPNFLKP